MLDRLVLRRSRYGIGFRQDFLVSNGGARVWYLDVEGEVADSFGELVRAKLSGAIDAIDPLWRLTPFVDFPGDYGTKRYEFQWEREWRVPGGLAFTPEDVAFLFLPHELHGPARVLFDDHRRQNTGPQLRLPGHRLRLEHGANPNGPNCGSRVCAHVPPFRVPGARRRRVCVLRARPPRRRHLSRLRETLAVKTATL